MVAFTVSLLFFCYLTVIGYAVLAPLNRADSPIRTALLAPAMGLAISVLPVFFINRFGMPVKDFALPLLSVTVISALVLIFVFRQVSVLPWRNYWAFAVIFLGAAVLTGRPMFDFGFDWLGFANDDMANYSLAAQRFYNHGLFDKPNIDDLIAGKDYS
jgi:hypothetical protein